jgi:hypothetical protein
MENKERSAAKHSLVHERMGNAGLDPRGTVVYVRYLSERGGAGVTPEV